MLNGAGGRYRFDPTKSVQDAMESIWKALVKDPVKAVDAHFKLILQVFSDRLSLCL